MLAEHADALPRCHPVPTYTRATDQCVRDHVMHAYERVLQSGVEDLGYARRIARLRAFHFDNPREVGPYLLSVPPAERRQLAPDRGRRLG